MANLFFDTLYRIYVCLTYWTKRIQIYIFFFHILSWVLERTYVAHIYVIKRTPVSAILYWYFVPYIIMLDDLYINMAATFILYSYTFLIKHLNTPLLRLLITVS